MTNKDAFDRRDALGLFLVAGAATIGSGADASAPAGGAALGGRKGAVGDWDWLVGSWKVRHRKLRERLVGSQDWFEFDGTCINWPLLAGQGNVDDNIFYTPEETYRGVGVRALDPESGLWSIWWLDSRAPTTIDVPVRGGFENGVGVFLSDDMWKGTPVKVRFRWSDISENAATWDQAFSTDGGTSWESNWVMRFTRHNG